jgi:hypothetical protein
MRGVQTKAADPYQESAATDAKGQIGFGTAFLSASGALVGLTGPRLPDI